MAVENVREQRVNEVLRRLGSLSTGYYNSSGIISKNMHPDEFKFFSFDLKPDELFEKGLYKSILSAVLTDFINKVRFDPKWEKLKLDSDSFFEYIDYLGVSSPDVSSIDYDRLRSFIKVDDNDALINVYYILSMIQQSLFTNDREIYERLRTDACNLGDRQLLKDAINFYDIQKGKKDLLDEWILVTMKKYYKGNSKGFLGKDLIFSYLERDNVNAITCDNNLRKRVPNNLKPDAVLEIIAASTIYNEELGIGKNIDNYINMVMINYIISSMNQVDSFNINHAIEQYLSSGDSKLIKMSASSGEKISELLSTLDKETMRKFFMDLGVESVEEYIDEYCSDRKGPKKG